MFFVAQSKTNDIITLNGFNKTKGIMMHAIDQVGASVTAAIKSLTGQEIKFINSFLAKDVTNETLKQDYEKAREQLKNINTLDSLIAGVKSLVYENGDASLIKVLHSALYPNDMTENKHDNYTAWSAAANFFVTHIQDIERQLNRVKTLKPVLNDITTTVNKLNSKFTDGVNLDDAKGSIDSVYTSLADIEFPGDKKDADGHIIEGAVKKILMIFIDKDGETFKDVTVGKFVGNIKGVIKD